MQHLLFEPTGVTVLGKAHIRDISSMLFERAYLLQRAGDTISLRARGRQVGLVFFRHNWSGEVEITIDEQRTMVNLYSDPPAHWVFESDLPESNGHVRITVRATGKHDPKSRGSEVWLETVYASDYRTNEIESLIRQHVSADPYTQDTLNQLTDVFKWYDPNWMAVNRIVGTSPYEPPDYVHRKAWEWTQCIYGLDVLGALRPEHRALGVGVGWEPLSFFLSNHLREVVATDLYPLKSFWSESGAREGSAEILDDPDRFAPFPYRRERLHFRRMDGKVLEFPDASFDVIWSCSSIEHFGKHVGAMQSMREIERVLKPGGVVAMITEYVLPDPRTGEPVLFDPEYFNLRCLYEYLIRHVPKLELVQKLDLSIPDYYVRRACKLPEEAEAPHNGVNKPHVVLRSPSGALHTSIALFFRKVGSSPRANISRLFGANDSPHEA